MLVPPFSSFSPVIGVRHNFAHVSFKLQPPAADRWGPLLQMEFEAAKKVHEERLNSWSLDRLKSEGLLLTGVSAEPSETSDSGKCILTLTMGDDQELPFHQFRWE